VCTIHQPSAVIFDAFDSLLLLRRGGQTVYFGDLGDNSADMVRYFESLPGVAPMPAGVNAATWMLDVIGSGGSSTDPREFYKQSSLCAVNTTRVVELCGGDLEALSHRSLVPLEGEVGGENPSVFDMFLASTGVAPSIGISHTVKVQEVHSFEASYVSQFQYLMRRFLLTYWRSPSYNFARMVVSIVVALIFSSTYADQKYSSDVDVVSRVALIYITCMFIGVVGMMSVQPVMFNERPAFYREQHFKIYDVRLYVLAATLVEVP
jgi:hypothetical protein